MIKLLGAVAAATACAWLGFRGADALRERGRTIRDMEYGLLLLEQELELRAPELPLLMEQLSERTQGGAARLFAACSAGLRGLEGQRFSSVWRQAVEGCSAFEEATAACLLPLGDSLGRCDVPAQIRATAAVRKRLNDLARETEEECRRQAAVYRALGISGGAFLVILLL